MAAATKRPNLQTDTARLHSLDRKVKRGDAHLFDLAAGCAFVVGIVMETLETLLTVWMRRALAFCRGKGFAIKSSPKIVSSVRTIHFTLPFSMLYRHRRRQFCAI